jgi:hypothetical protein
MGHTSSKDDLVAYALYTLILFEYRSQKAMVSGYGMRKANVREASPKLQILAGIQIQATCSGIR